MSRRSWIDSHSLLAGVPHDKWRLTYRDGEERKLSWLDPRVESVLGFEIKPKLNIEKRHLGCWDNRWDLYKVGSLVHLGYNFLG